MESAGAPALRDGITALNRPLQLWGGVECSTPRIHDTWRDQVRETGHHDRISDLTCLTALGIRTVRYPVLWERVTQSHPSACGWQWHDMRMNVLRQLDITVVGGLLHHGSGPATTNLLDPDFPERLAQHAATAAARYPFITSWTPVNEPLTTARFSCLYGYWYPHLRDTNAFLRALVNQCRAVLLSMRAIRLSVPDAQLIQTEDLGRIFSTSPLEPQAAYENERRWLSLDLLCGRVDRAHSWRSRFESAGVSARHLDELATGEGIPSVIGVNYYVTSDRFLDHRLELYPADMRGDSGIGYVDTEAVRVNHDQGVCGWEARLREVWKRYRLPLAVTEAHLGCQDEREQVRWLMQAWNAAQKLRMEGADVRAVTAWAMFGLVDWDSMLRERRNHYEPGVFDASGGLPQPTLLADAVRALATEGRFVHAELLAPGWWQRADRFGP